VDEDGEQYDTKQTLAVPTDSSELAQPRVSMEERIRELAVKLQAIVKDNPMTLLKAMQSMPRATGVRTILREANLTARHLVENNPDLFEKRGKKIIARTDYREQLFHFKHFPGI